MAKANPALMPSIEDLRAWLEYDPETGLFTRKVGPRIGAPALRDKHIRGYLFGSICMVRILAHRAAWAITYGEWAETVDHINWDKTDNRLVNLRAVSQAENAKNKPPAAGCGVFYLRRKNRWAARVGGVYLGCFKTEEEARAKYMAAWASRNTETIKARNEMRAKLQTGFQTASYNRNAST